MLLTINFKWIMEKRSYKTLIGLLKQTRQMRVYDFFSGRMYVACIGWINFTIDDSVKRMVAEKFSEYLLSTKKRRQDLVNALMEGRGELDYFQCFYIEYSPTHGIYFSNSLSGEAFNCCKRNYLRKYC